MAKKAKQGHLSGMEPDSIPEIDKAADAYVEARDARMTMSKKEVERRNMLHGLMKQHKLTTYKTSDEKTVNIISGDEKIKVSRAKDANEDSVEVDGD